MGLKPNRRSSAMGLGISLVVILVYYLLTGLSIGLAAVINPLIAA